MLYAIIKQLQQTSSTNDKLAIMEANKDNKLFKEYMRLVTCPSVSFYVTTKTLPMVDKCFARQHQFDIFDLEHCAWAFAERNLTGGNAKTGMKKWMEDQATMEDVELCRMLLLKDIRAKIGVTLVNKVWPSLCVDVPYQRCSLPDKKKLDKFSKVGTFVVQTKGDGMFAAMVIDRTQRDNDVSIYTRNGNKFPKWFGWHISDGLDDNQAVYEGELLCFREGKLLSRKEGNGILNSIMQGGDRPEGVSIQYHVWNRLPLEDWKKGSTDIDYIDLHSEMWRKIRGVIPKPDIESNSLLTKVTTNAVNIMDIDMMAVECLEDAYEFNREQLAKGLEGSVIKTLTHKWKNGTSNECLKLKIEAEIDLEIVSIEEASGKDKGCAGRVNAKSSCGKLITGVNCNGEQKDRKALFEQRHSYIGKIFTCLANDVVDNELIPDKMSLFLARSDVSNEIRTDKDEADSLERIHEIFNAVKGIKND